MSSMISPVLHAMDQNFHNYRCSLTITLVQSIRLNEVVLKPCTDTNSKQRYDSAITSYCRNEDGTVQVMETVSVIIL